MIVYVSECVWAIVWYLVAVQALQGVRAGGGVASEWGCVGMAMVLIFGMGVRRNGDGSEWGWVGMPPCTRSYDVHSVLICAAVTHAQTFPSYIVTGSLRSQ